MFGSDVVITEGGKIIGTKHVNEYGDISDSELADDPDLDVDTREFLIAISEKVNDFPVKQK